ncbi:unnamed protein product [Clonostachys rosea]|uniref:DUF7726 domain-containing protein n=1 Tax=Bionectria ochroleuca TaxID=29856 RepID=A0ABY6ULW0_BIOOC|nr:unnamed protein product [Clonostachys rosea]
MSSKQPQPVSDVTPLGERNPNVSISGPPTKEGKPTVLSATDRFIKELMFPDDAPQIDDNDPRLLFCSDTPGQVRTKIRRWIDSGAQTEDEFRETIGVPPEDFWAYMALKSPMSGQVSDIHRKAMLFFKKRVIQCLPLQLSKPKPVKAAASKPKKPANDEKSKEMERLLDTGDYILPGEEEGDVDIYETPREVRRKMRALLAKGVTQAAFARALSEMLPEGAGTLSPQTMKAFLAQKGVMDGNTSKAFYCGYVFFEKQRLRDNKPMSKHREAMEELHPTGVNTTNNPKTTTYITSSATKSLSYDQFGLLHSNRY